MDNERKVQACQQASHPWEIFDIDMQEDSTIFRLKKRFGETRLLLCLRKRGFQPHFDLPYPRNRRERLLHRFECRKMGTRRKRFTRRLDVGDPIQAKEALSLSQVA